MGVVPDKEISENVQGTIDAMRPVYQAAHNAYLDGARFLKYLLTIHSFAKKDGNLYSPDPAAAQQAGWSLSELIVMWLASISMGTYDSTLVYDEGTIAAIMSVIGSPRRYFFDEPYKYSTLPEECKGESIPAWKRQYYPHNPYDSHRNLDLFLRAFASNARARNVPFGVSWGVHSYDWRSHFTAIGSCPDKNPPYPYSNTSSTVDPSSADYIMIQPYPSSISTVANIDNWFYGSPDNPSFREKVDTIWIPLWELGYAIHHLLENYPNREGAELDMLANPRGCFDPNIAYKDYAPYKLDIKAKIEYYMGRQNYEWWKNVRVNCSAEKYMGDLVKYVYLYMVKPDHCNDIPGGCPDSGEYFFRGDEYVTSETYDKIFMAAYNSSPVYPEE